MFASVQKYVYFVLLNKIIRFVLLQDFIKLLVILIVPWRAVSLTIV